MFKIFYPTIGLEQLPFCLEPKNIKAVLSNPDDTQSSVLVLEPKVIHDIKDGGYYERILVKGAVIDTLVYLNKLD